jgi:conjugal transfer pilus assembly protein TraU
MSMFKKLLVTAALLLSTVANAVVPAVCTGTLFNPITDTDWNNIFPITIAGVPIPGGGNSTPPLMQAMPPICTCPTVFGIPFVGIGLTWWQPMYVSEIERRPGCLSSLGGVQALNGYSMLHSEQTVADNNNTGESSNRMQVHWYEYPVMSMLQMMESISCKNANGFNLAYVTEVDPLWQDDLWSSIFTPESALFSNPIAVASCAIDAVASTFDFPMDAMFWCAGTWGAVYPLAGNSGHSGDPFTMNNQIQAKFLARSHRMGLQWQTIGPTAVCAAHPNPIWVKSQYRFNQVAPVPRRGRAVVTGSNGKLFQFPPVTNPPTQEHTVNLIWQGQQCCAKAIP